MSQDATGKFSSRDPLPDRSCALVFITGSARRHGRAPSTGRLDAGNADTRTAKYKTCKAMRFPEEPGSIWAKGDSTATWARTIMTSPPRPEGSDIAVIRGQTGP